MLLAAVLQIQQGNFDTFPAVAAALPGRAGSDCGRIAFGSGLYDCCQRGLWYSQVRAWTW